MHRPSQHTRLGALGRRLQLLGVRAVVQGGPGRPQQVKLSGIKACLLATVGLDLLVPLGDGIPVVLEDFVIHRPAVLEDSTAELIGGVLNLSLKMA
ncbi:MAG: hypothetical protein JWR01_2888 [Subtercola sp.]|nr:hypothetical protein [Subtercola sp.]